jgi:hypothetical protein
MYGREAGQVLVDWSIVALRRGISRRLLDAANCYSAVAILTECNSNRVV